MPILLVFGGFVFVSLGWSAAPFGALYCAVLLLLWLQVRCGIYVSGRGVRVVRFFGSVVVPWDQLTAVEVSSTGWPIESGSGERPQVLLRTTSGAVIPTEVYRGFTGRRNDVWLRPTTFDRLVAKLRELQKEEQQDPGA
jgi:hypothetical protein